MQQRGTMGWGCYFIFGKDLSEEVTFEMRFVRGKGSLKIQQKSIARMRAVKFKDSEQACRVEETRRLMWLECGWWV